MITIKSDEGPITTLFYGVGLCLDTKKKMSKKDKDILKRHSKIHKRALCVYAKYAKGKENIKLMKPRSYSWSVKGEDDFMGLLFIPISRYGDKDLRIFRKMMTKVGHMSKDNVITSIHIPTFSFKDVDEIKVIRETIQMIINWPIPDIVLSVNPNLIEKANKILAKEME